MPVIGFPFRKYIERGFSLSAQDHAQKRPDYKSVPLKKVEAWIYKGAVITPGVNFTLEFVICIRLLKPTRLSKCESSLCY